MTTELDRWLTRTARRPWIRFDKVLSRNDVGVRTNQGGVYLRREWALRIAPRVEAEHEKDFDLHVRNTGERCEPHLVYHASKREFHLTAFRRNSNLARGSRPSLQRPSNAGSTALFAVRLDRSPARMEVWIVQDTVDVEDTIADRLPEISSATTRAIQTASRRTGKLRSGEYAAALALANKSAKKMEGIRRIAVASSFARDRRVADLLKRQRDHVCQLCGTVGFVKRRGGHYAETHHVVELSKGGGLQSFNVIVVCAQCHRKLHYAAVSVVSAGGGYEVTINGDAFEVEAN